VKLKLEKPISWLINYLLSAFFVFGILILFEQSGSKGWEWYSRIRLCWPVLICFICGTAVRKNDGLKLILLFVSCVAAGIIIFLLFPYHSAQDILFIFAATILSAGLYLMGLRGEEAFPPRLAIASIIVYIFDLIYFFNGGKEFADFAAVSWLSLITFLLSLYSFNASSLSSGVHNAKGGEVMSMPAGIRGKNLLLLTLFIILAVLIGNLEVLHNFLRAVSTWLLRAVVLFLKFFSNLGSGDSVQSTPEPSVEPTKELVALEPGDGDPVFVTIYISLMIVIGLVFLVFLVIAFTKEGKRGGGFGRLSSFLKRLFKTRQILEYEDSVESTLDIKDILRKRSKRFRELWDKLTYRPERFEDMPDNRKKIRFAYKMLLKSRRVSGWTPSATPGEVGAVLKTESLKTLTEHYNSARYNEAAEITEDEVNNARRSLDDMKGRGRNG
jgi:hypothetical protein